MRHRAGAGPGLQRAAGGVGCGWCGREERRRPGPPRVVTERGWGRGASSHRHAGLGQQLQHAGQAKAWGHGQQPARVVPGMGPLKEQRRLFVPPRPRRGCRSLPHSHLSARTLPRRRVFPPNLCASALETARHGGGHILRLRKGWSVSRLTQRRFARSVCNLHRVEG